MLSGSTHHLSYTSRGCSRAQTVLSLLGLRPLNVPGCPERFWHTFFAKEGILRWCISRHGSARKRLGERMQVEGVREEEINS
ncbi:hypothetical protein C8F01DRAFT_1164985 [Mycena amicta]|nr:hypothetical protein C8F01DRAFT_1171890 [Mycena amicta]KAJ7053847.1 hypothetical protein C8F01DRAFT_1164985 [Mycena amicta]